MLPYCTLELALKFYRLLFLPVRSGDYPQSSAERWFHTSPHVFVCLLNLSTICIVMTQLLYCLCVSSCRTHETLKSQSDEAFLPTNLNDKVLLWKMHVYCALLYLYCTVCVCLSLCICVCVHDQLYFLHCNLVSY